MATKMAAGCSISSLYVCSHGVLDDLLSDHFPVFAIRKKGREIIVKTKKRVRIYKNYNENNFTLLFNEIDWNEYYNCLDVNILWDMMHYRMQEILEIMCPFKTIYVRKDHVPWFTNEIYECIRKRLYYVKLFRTSRNDDIFLLSKYFRNKCNCLIRNAKSEYIKTSLDTNVNNPRKYWKILNSMLKTNNDNITDFEFKNQTTNENVPLSNTADFLNEYFSNVGVRKTPNLNRYPDEYIDCDTLTFGDVTILEIKKLIAEIDVMKDSCVEGVSSGILKSGFMSNPNALAYLFEQSLKQGIFPRKWAIGYINILPKGGDKTNPSNWRPITQTCLPAKMLEKIVQKRIMLHLNRYDILNDGQFGFRAERSTQKVIFELLYDVHKSLNVKDTIGLLFLDISKAFDSLDHEILLEKLRKIRLGKNSLCWFESYLNRVQVVRHNGLTSNQCKFQYGIPQGSCLGPTLFIFYMNELFKYIGNVKVVMFADDCVLYESGKRWDTIHNSLQEALNVYVNWGEDHNLRLNVSKTKAMYISTTYKMNEIENHAPFNAGNSNILFVKKFCYLGFILDNELSMLPEYKAVYRRIEHKVYMLGKLRYFIDKKAALLVYKQAILPYLDYAGFVLLACGKGLKKDLQKLQNNGLRICLRYCMIDHVTIERLHEEANLQSLEQRRLFQALKLIYGCSKKVDYLKITANRTRAESKIVFDVPDKCTNKYLNSPFYKGVHIWNSLLEPIQRSDTIDVFTKYVKPMYKKYVNLLDV